MSALKTVGQLISQSRSQKNLSLTYLSRVSLVEPKYLRLLESDQTVGLPEPTFVKGFLKRLAPHLELDPEILLAAYRRDTKPSQKLKLNVISHDHLRKPQSLTGIILGLLGIFVFLLYLGFQYRALLIPPRLTLTKPDTSVTVSPVAIEGQTSNDAVLTINSQNVDRDPNGFFSTSLDLPIGEHQLVVTAVNRFGKKNTKTLNLTIVSPQ